MSGLLRRAVERSGLIIELVGYGFWFLIDVVVSTSAGSVLSPLPGLVVAGIVLLRLRPDAHLPRIAAAAVGASIVFSALARFPILGAVLPPLGLDARISFPSFTEQLALAIVVVAVLHRGNLLPALVLAGAAGIAIVGSPLARSADTLAPLSGLGWGGAVALGLVLREIATRRRVAVDDVRTSERMELARELHDVVAHHVTGIVVAAQAAAIVARRSPDDVDRALAAIETAGVDALDAMRSMVGVLRGQDSTGARTPGAELGQVPALVRSFDPDSRLVRLTGDPGVEHAVLPAGVAATGYRVVQEALTNVRRHAPEAATVEVDVRIRERTLLVTVRNDGLPALPNTPRGGPGGFGLAGMAERVSALDGTLTAGPSAPGVWTVAVRLPIRTAR